MPFYRVYGLSLDVNMPVPGLIALPPDGPADIRVILGSTPDEAGRPPHVERVTYVSSYRCERGEPTLTAWYRAENDSYRLRYPDGTEFFVAGSGEGVWATGPDTLTPEDTATYLLGPILGFVLMRRGVTTLHASSVSADGRALAFLGPAGAGKST